VTLLGEPWVMLVVAHSGSRGVAGCVTMREHESSKDGRIGGVMGGGGLAVGFFKIRSY